MLQETASAPHPSLRDTLSPQRERDGAASFESAPALETRLWLKEGAARSHATRRRARAGPVGCGLCGVESIAEALPPLAPVISDFRVGAEEVVAAVRALHPLQTLNEATRAAHAAAFYAPGEGIVCVREDVGRHTALDKLIGALARARRACATGAVLMTSRVSVELIQKAARAHAPMLAAVSAPTTLALEAAHSAGICVCAIVRDNGMEVFTHPERIFNHAD
jgi:FdhD protein